MKNHPEIEQIADAIIQNLRGKVVIHRYDAYSTCSVYLKFDYGTANSLRISDHPGKRHLKYRYNIMLCEEKKHTEYRHGFEMVYYSPKMIKSVCRDILQAKAEKVKRYRDYDAIVQKMKESSQGQTSGFWKNAVLVE